MSKPKIYFSVFSNIRTCYPELTQTNMQLRKKMILKEKYIYIVRNKTMRWREIDVETD